MNKSPDIQLRPLEIKDVEILEKWDNEPHVKESGWDVDWDWEKEISTKYDWRWMFMAELNGAPLGCIQIIDPKKEITQYWGEVAENLRALDIWIGDASNLSKGYGSIMMKLALEFCFENDKVDGVLIDPLISNHKAIRFYEKLGFEFVEERFFGEEGEQDHCKVYFLNRDKWVER